MGYQDMINRGAIAVLPKQPFWDWANSLEKEPVWPGDMEKEATFYLIRGNWKDVNKTVRKYWEDIFNQELYSWHTDEADWPQNRNYRMFKKWFDFMAGTCIFDLIDERILIR